MSELTVMKRKRIVFTGGSGRFGQILKKSYNKDKFEVLFPSSKTLNILDVKTVEKYLKSKKPN